MDGLIDWMDEQALRERHSSSAVRGGIAPRLSMAAIALARADMLEDISPQNRVLFGARLAGSECIKRMLVNSWVARGLQLGWAR